MTMAAESPSSRVPRIAFAASALVALLVGVLSRVHEPSLAGTTSLGYSTVLGAKVVLSVGIAVLLVVQLGGALWMYGKFGVRAPKWVGPAHRVSGMLAVALSLFVAYLCFMSLGFEIGTIHTGEAVPLRVVIHGVVGCAAVGAIVLKITAVRSQTSPAWFLPVAGGTLLSLLAAALLTSTAWYLAAKGWPTRA